MEMTLKKKEMGNSEVRWRKRRRKKRKAKA